VGGAERSELEAILRGLLGGRAPEPGAVSERAWRLMSRLGEEGLELLADRELRPAWERLIEAGILSGDEDLYRLADRWEILRRLARRVLHLMSPQDVEAGARAVLVGDLESTSLGREVLKRSATPGGRRR